jgi:hypothetical protein
MSILRIVLVAAVLPSVPGAVHHNTPEIAVADYKVHHHTAGNADGRHLEQEWFRH